MKTLEECLEFLRGLLDKCSNPSKEEILKIIKDSDKYDREDPMFIAATMASSGVFLYKIKEFLESHDGKD